MTADTTLRIETLVAGGDGLAREPGRPVAFVPATAPGDLVRVRLGPESRGLRRGRVVEILEPGRGRREPPCPHASDCGGCPWMHLTEEAQAEAATSILEAALRRAGARVAPGAVRAASPPATPLGHRHRMRLHLDLRDAPRCGFLRRESHDVQPVPRCIALAPRLEDARRAVEAALPRLAAILGRRRAELAVDLPGDEGTALLRADVPAAAAREALALLRDAAPGLSALAARDGAGRATAELGPPAVAFRRGPLEEPARWPAFHSPGGFLQAGAEGAALLTSRVLEAARANGLARDARALELYAGSGQLTLPLAGLGLDVEAGDADATAVANAERALRECAGELVTAPRLLALDAATHARRLVQAGRTFDAVVLDPPRTGAKEVVPSLAALAPLVLSVSCDAPTFARDAALLGRAGFEIVAAEPLLLFPQSAHFEIVAVLRRTEAAPSP